MGEEAADAAEPRRVGVMPMLKVRKRHMQAFEAAAVREFENEVVRSAGRLVPGHAHVLGEEGVRRTARLGLERAERYGFTNRGPARFYTEMMLLFGSDFDTDPQLPWAAPTLKDPAAGDQMARAERLWLRTQDFLDRVAGPGGELTRDALRRARRAAAEDQSEPPPGPDELLRGLEALHPQRCQAIGEAAMRAVAARAAELARPYAAEAGALPLFATLVFLLGHGVAADPQFPWAAAALAKASPTTPAGRLRELRSAWMAYLDRVLG